MGLLALSLPLSMELDKVFESISWFNPHESTQLSFHWDSGEAVIHIFNSLERWKSILLSILCKVIVLTPALVYIAWYIKKEFKIFNQKIVEIQKG
jgi:hypothetical protein